jgi:hypothetical protein
MFQCSSSERYRQDYRTGLLASMIANFAGAKSTPEDFIPSAKKRPRQTPQEQYEILKNLTLALGGTVSPEGSN